MVVAETVDGKLEMEAYVMPNQIIDNNVPLTSFQVSVHTIILYLINIYNTYYVIGINLIKYSVVLGKSNNITVPIISCFLVVLMY